MHTRDLELIRQMIFAGGARFPLTTYLLTYKCTRCGHKWEEISLVKNESCDCGMGCTNPPRWLALVRVCTAILTGRDAFGVGILVEWEELDMGEPIPKRPITAEELRGA